ncbi:MAG TPA: alpha/beta fold hydrolase [Blastocatellia bacterium]|nr:alpha/beta fold hydrolase [Blastocatellia bacterium]
MPYAKNQEVRIHYRVEGAGLPLVLQHGYTDSLESWYEQGYVGALQHACRLILIDARGHGASDKPHHPDAYATEHQVADILAVLDALDLPTANFWGFSMGGQIGFGLAKHAARRFTSLILGGADPYQGNRAERDKWLPMLRQGMDGFIQQIWESGGPISPGFRARLLANDVDALIANRIKVMERPDFAEVLSSMHMRCLLYVGEADGRYAGLKACVPHLPDATFVSLPGLNHIESFYRADLVLPHVMRFLPIAPTR